MPVSAKGSLDVGGACLSQGCVASILQKMWQNSSIVGFISERNEQNGSRTGFISDASEDASQNNREHTRITSGMAAE